MNMYMLMLLEVNLLHLEAILMLVRVDLIAEQAEPRRVRLSLVIVTH